MLGTYRIALVFEAFVAALFCIVLSTLSRGQVSSAGVAACSDDARLTLERAEESVWLRLDGGDSGRYVIVAIDPRANTVVAPRVVGVGWHDSAHSTVIELGQLTAGAEALALRALFVPLGARRGTALMGPMTMIDPWSGGPSSLLAVVPMRIRSCALGCSSGGLAGAQISCGVTNTFQNQDLSFRFTLPIDATSVSANSFSVVNVATGAVPPGALLVDAADARTLIFRPALNFDALGNPVFGLQNGGTYQLRIPGVMQGDLGPFVLSTTGLPNEHRLLCAITADQGLMDYVPGAPHVAISVDVVTSYDSQTGLPNGFAHVPAANATNVWVGSNVTFDFDDIMNPATLVNPSLGVMPFIQVKVDADGDLSTLGDQVTQPGTPSFSLDLNLRTCRLVFDPVPRLPRSGTGPTPSKIVIRVPSPVTDITGNPVANAGVISFQTEP